MSWNKFGRTATMRCVLGCKDGEDGWSEVVYSAIPLLFFLSPHFPLLPPPLLSYSFPSPLSFSLPFSSSIFLLLLSSPSLSSSSSGLKLDYSAVDMKRGKLVHVPEATYKKGCVQNVQQGMQVHFALQGRNICYFTFDAIFSINCVITLFLVSIVP